MVFRFIKVTTTAISNQVNVKVGENSSCFDICINSIQ